MDRFGAVAQGRFDDFVDAEIAFRGRGGAEMGGFIGHADGERGAVGVGINGDARDVHVAEGANEADGDFTAIGDQDLAEHKGPIVAGSGSRGIKNCDGRAPASGFGRGVGEGIDEGGKRLGFSLLARAGRRFLGHG